MNDPRLEGTSRLLAQLSLCQVRLVDCRDYKWLLLIPQVDHASELIDLTHEDQMQLMAEIDQVSRVLKNLYSPHKLNVATLGNVVPQLHIHVVCRYKHDKAWPGNIWNGLPVLPYDEGDLEESAIEIQDALRIYKRSIAC